MSRPRLDIDDEHQLTGEYNPSEPAISIEQYTIDDGTQLHVIRADTDQDGSIDAEEYTERSKDGSSARGLIQKYNDGSSSDREVDMDRSGRVTSIREEKRDKQGNLTTGRYDDDGDGKIDRELRDIDGDGELDEVQVNNRKGKASRFDFEAKGEWAVDADGDGDTDWRSSLKAGSKGLDHSVDVYEDGNVVARDQSHMDRAGNSRDMRIDNDRDGILDERDITRADASGHRTYAEQDRAEGVNVIDKKIDRDGDGDVDIWQNDYDRDGDMDDVRIR
jgi:hypothetical protein